MANNEISMPGAFGGLMRYKEEYNSKFKLSPAQVIVFALIVTLLVVGMRIFFPIAATTAQAAA